MNYNLNYFYFKKFSDNFLLTNELGKYIFIKEEDFIKIKKKEKINKELYDKLIQNYFIYSEDRELFIDKYSKEIRKYKSYLFEKTQLHIFVLTGNCNLTCVYCQANIHIDKNRNKNMTKETAEKAVDFLLKSEVKNLTIEFQGGEPLLNFDILRHIVTYVRDKNQEIGKNIIFNLVSNLTLISDEIIRFLLENNIHISTSLDGDSLVHNHNRNINGKPTFDIVEKNIIKIQEKLKKESNIKNIGAIQTTTKISLNKYREIVDQYLELGINDIFIRPLSPMGEAKNNWNKIGYTPDKFLLFYENVINYMIFLNKKGIKVKEVHASIFLKKILTNISLNYMELRSPCGGTLGQIAYNYDGGIFTCDEARMIAEEGDNSFKIGDVRTSSWKNIFNNKVTETVCISSCLEILTSCSECVYNPYCGTCPVYNYIEQKNVFAKQPYSYRCKIYKGMLDIFFKKIEENNDETIKLFLEWAN